MAKEKLQIIPLGGLGEIGKNMTVIRYGEDIIVLDAGMAFPEEDMLGIDIVIPDFSYLIENKDKIRAIVITHGHEDHIGSLSYLMKEVSAPIYAARLTCGLIEGKLKEARIGRYEMNVIETGKEYKAGCFKFGFFHVCHSIPDSCGIYFRTPVGTVVHTGDFKFDHTPADGQLMDVHKLAELGQKGVLLLLADSTNAERPGYTPSESVVADTLMKAYAGCRGRIILATFASNVSRIQMAVDAAIASRRKVCVFGRSMVNVVGIAREMGYLKAPEGVFIEPEEMNRYRDDQLCILTTGSQGEPMAGLSRMADGSHRQVQIHAGDTVIISASPIPGNEMSVGRTIDKLMRLGAHVISSTSMRVHVSGHGSQEELKTMQALVKPKFFIPVHGEYRMLCQHAEIAERIFSSARTAWSLNSRPAPAAWRAKSRRARSSWTVSAWAMWEISSSATGSSSLRTVWSSWWWPSKRERTAWRRARRISSRGASSMSGTAKSSSPGRRPGWRASSTGARRGT